MIDLLNQRLSAGTRLRQREVLHIFSDVAKAVARLHHRTKPTIHRDDLKVSTIESLYNIHINLGSNILAVHKLFIRTLSLYQLTLL